METIIGGFRVLGFRVGDFIGTTTGIHFPLSLPRILCTSPS